MLASAWSTTTCLIVFPGVAVLGAECVSEPPLRSGESSKEDNVYARNKALQSAGMAIELIYRAVILAQGNRPVGSRQKGRDISTVRALSTSAGSYAPPPY